MPPAVVIALLVAFPLIGLVLAYYYANQVALVKIGNEEDEEEDSEALISTQSPETLQKIQDISDAIAEGASSFLTREYQYVLAFMTGFVFVIIFLIGPLDGWKGAGFTAIAFVVGCSTSIVCGFIGMKIAVFANSRTALEAVKGYESAFNVAFKAGAVMGLALISLGLLILVLIIGLFYLAHPKAFKDQKETFHMMEAVAGYGLGGSAYALFGRVGGGIFTKAADVGADLSGKLEAGLDEDDPANPAVIADNVGDNVGDIAGMGADLFGSFAEATVATLVISSQSKDLSKDFSAMMFPLAISAFGILVACFCTLIPKWFPTKEAADIEPQLKRQILWSTIMMTPIIFMLSFVLLPAKFKSGGTSQDVTNWEACLCAEAGLWAGLAIGYITEYYTSNRYEGGPVQQVYEATKTGAATNIISGLALGYESVVGPAVILAFVMYGAITLAGQFGVACAVMGMLSTLCCSLTIDGYGPISDNAGGIAEMSGMDESVREVTDVLDAAGNTTAAIGKGFAIGSASLVSLALLSAFVASCDIKMTVDLLSGLAFAGLMIGAMLPYWFSAMTMRSVSMAAGQMVEEVRRQFAENPRILTHEDRPDYTQCVAIATEASLKEMIPPGMLVILTPLIVGYAFGVTALAGVLAGAQLSAVMLAISASNTGGAWDNTKKYIEARKEKGTPLHQAAVIGDTVGDPLKDTSGPSLNILMKLMAIISVVFARSFPKFPANGYLIQLFEKEGLKTFF